MLSLIPCRRHLAGLLKEHSLVEGGDLQVATWIKDEGFDTTIPSVMQVQHPNSMHMLVRDLNGGLPLCKKEHVHHATCCACSADAASLCRGCQI